jgi:hypothetical protein
MHPDPYLIVVIVCSLAFWFLRERFMTQEKKDIRTAHATELASKDKAHEAEKKEIRTAHQNEIERLQKAHDDEISRQQKTTEKLIEAARTEGQGSVQVFARRAVVGRKNIFVNTKREVVVAAVYTKDKLLAHAGEFDDLQEVDIPPELKKLLTAVAAHGAVPPGIA